MPRARNSSRPSPKPSDRSRPPSAKKAFCLSELKFANGRTAIDFSDDGVSVEADGVVGSFRRELGDHFFEARVPAQRIPTGVEAEIAGHSPYFEAMEATICSNRASPRSGLQVG